MTDDACDLLCIDLELAEELRTTRLPGGLARAAADRARALGDPTRLTVLAALASAGSADLCACDLSWITERSEQLVGHHLRALRRAGLVTSRRDGRMVRYRLTDHGRTLLDVLLAAAKDTR